MESRDCSCLFGHSDRKTEFNGASISTQQQQKKAESNSSRLKRNIWIVVRTIMLIFFSIHSSLLLRQFSEAPVSVKYFPRKSEFVQPDILFCFEPIFSESSVMHVPPVDTAERRFYDSVVAEVHHIDQQLGRKMSRRKAISHLLSHIKISRLLRAFHYSTDELVLELKCGSEPIKQKLQFEMNYFHLACLRVQPTMCSLKNHRIMAKFYIHAKRGHSTNKTQNSNSSSSWSGVHLQGVPLHHYRFPLQADNDLVRGVYIYFTSSLRIEDPVEAVGGVGGRHTEIVLSATNYKYAHSCRLHPTPSAYYNLAQPNDILLAPLHYDNSISCLFYQLQTAIYDMFHCVVLAFPVPMETVPANFSFCSVTHRPKRFKLIKGRVAKTCASHQDLCRATVYQTAHNQLRWPIDSDLEQLMQKLRTGMTLHPGIAEMLADVDANPLHMRDWSENFYKITISKVLGNVTLIEESRSYGLQNLLSDIGGILGFYIGASLLTLCELFHRLLGCIHKKHRRRRRENDRTKMSLDPEQGGVEELILEPRRE